MQKMNDLVLGLDTSNYTTSLALTDSGGAIITDERTILKVKQGERGLRQSHALFQHMENLPALIEDVFRAVRAERIKGIAASSRPRPVEGSYMPVFKAGVSFGKALASGLSVPFYTFSHQEGHIAAAAYRTPLSDSREYLAFHLSGGTCELLFVNNDRISVLGSSKDLSFGQVIDRLGVAMDMNFPAGKELDRLALSLTDTTEKSCFKPIPFDGFNINLSGLETQAGRLLESKAVNKVRLVYFVFEEISKCLIKWTEKAIAETCCRDVLYTGGVSSSLFIRSKIGDYFAKINDINTVFGQASLSSDNAAGIALLGGKMIWQSNR